jgi:hypothetical protein
MGNKLDTEFDNQAKVPFDGAIDEVAIFDRALTGKEIRQLYQLAGQE